MSRLTHLRKSKREKTDSEKSNKYCRILKQLEKQISVIYANKKSD